MDTGLSDAAAQVPSLTQTVGRSPGVLSQWLSTIPAKGWSTELQDLRETPPPGVAPNCSPRTEAAFQPTALGYL